MRTMASFSFAALLVLVGCGDDDSSTADAGDGGGGGVPDAGRVCPPADGTVVGDCMHFDCALRAFSRGLCGTSEYGIDNCADLASLPMDYQMTADTYFTSCEAAFPRVMDTDVDVGMGMTLHVTRCTISSCLNKFASQRLYMCMAGVYDATCAPSAVPSECDLPDPPGYVCR